MKTLITEIYKNDRVTKVRLNRASGRFEVESQKILFCSSTDYLLAMAMADEVAEIEGDLREYINNYSATLPITREEALLQA